MSSASNTASTSSNYGTLIDTALREYSGQTGMDLRNHPLADRIDSCDGPDSILEIFQEQARAADKFKKDDNKLFKSLRPVVNVLHALSTNSTVSPTTFLIIYCMHLNSIPPQVFPPVKAVFSGIAILLSVRISLNIFAPTFTFCTARWPGVLWQVTTT